MMDQFKDGLAVGGVLSFMQNNFDLLRQLFVDEKPPLTVGIWNLYKFVQSQLGHLQVY